MKTSNYYLINVGNKSSQVVRTESRFFDITDCKILTDGHINDNDGLIPNAVEVSAQEVADLVAKSAKAKVRSSKIRRLQKEAEI